MLLAVYRLLTWVALPIVAIYHWYRSMSRGRKTGFKERFGGIAPQSAAVLTGQPAFWLHAVSVGEVVAARPLLRGLRKEYAGYRLLLTVTTETGRGVAEKDGLADVVTYFPFDIDFAVRRLLDTVKPRAVIFMETEIWPVFTCEAKRRNIPLMLANGRISGRSFPRYRRFAWFFRPVLHRFDALGMQTEADRERILAAGAPPQRSLVLGNLKYDIPSSPVTSDERRDARARFRIPFDLPVLTAGSTHLGEEEQVLAAWQGAHNQHAGLLLVLVPRHPERADEVERLIRDQGVEVVRRSQLERLDGWCHAGMVLLVDTVGELMPLYALADLAFVGGSLVPAGGHNLLEPASRGIPALFGPCMDNFREITGLVLAYGAGVQVADWQQLQQEVAAFLTTPELAQVIGANGLKLLRDRGGATKRYLAVLDEVLKR